MHKENHMELCQKYRFDHTNKWYMHNLDSVLENETRTFLWDFAIQSDHLISAKQPDLIIFSIVDFAVPSVHRIKLKKKAQRRISISTLLENFFKMWNMKVTVIPIVIGVLFTVTVWLVQGLEDMTIRARVEIIQIKALLRSTRIQRRVLETCCHSISSKR